MRRRTPLYALAALLLLLAAGCRDGTDTAAVEPAPERPQLRFRPTTPVNVPLPNGYKIEALTDGLERPSGLAATPDGRLLIAEQETGRVRVYRDGLLAGGPWATVEVSFPPDSVLHELGLVGIAVDPRFTENGFVYLYYTTSDGDDGRATVLVRMRDVNGVGMEPTTLLRIDEGPRNQHIAGGMVFVGDALLVGVGDHERPEAAQRIDDIAGSVIRIDRDGNALPDNPFVDQAGADPRIYVTGVRNPFGIAADPASGRVYFSDNRDVEGDALYELVPGENYGWPDEPLVRIEPILVYNRSMGISGVEFYSAETLPDFRGSVLFCSFHDGGMLHWSDVTPGLTSFDLVRRDRVIATGCSTDVATGADGFIYFASYEGQLLRISR
jgi:glucose/arabinose dehydrogenase